MNLIIASSGGFLAGGILVTIFLLFILFIVLIGIAARYKKCPSDQVLVIFGKTKGDKAARCIHGGAAFIVPIIQSYQYMDLTPISINVDLRNALSKQNIRVDVPSSFTVGISTEPGVMQNAAERLLGLRLQQIQELADDIENTLMGLGEREVESKQIGNMVMDRLKEVDEVAYVRFASVYRQFKDINTFIDELEKLLVEKKKG